MFWKRIRVKKRRVVRRRAAPAPARYLVHKEAARELVHERLAHFNAHYNFEYKKVAIRNQRSRWGSCSKKGNLNFNYKIVFLSPEERDYIIVHELCHLKEFNHGPAFWNLVKEQSPNFLALRYSVKRLSV